MLNESQEKAVYTKEPFLFLLAGAGTGKTSVIVARIKHLINSGIKPEKILAITFTNKASKEMKKRINHENISVHTFHQFCFKKLKEHLDYCETIYEDELPFTDDERLKITTYKNSLFTKKKPKMYEEYQLFLKEKKAKDFDDLLIDFHHYFHKLEKHISYDYIFVDEFQDTNLLQYLIIKKMAKKNTHIFCVGDPDQSIYRFRGAHDKIIEIFIKEFHASIYKLTLNYRSSKQILMIANGIIKRNNSKHKKVLMTYNNYESNILNLSFNDMTDEAIYISNKINDYIKSGIQPSEIAVLFRNHHRSFYLRQRLDGIDIKYQSDRLKSTFFSSVHLLSLHQAKGLEFSFVFIIGLEQGTLPSYHAKTQLDLEEERRLFFVGITRAKKDLYLSHVWYNNDTEYIKKSQFLIDLKKPLSKLENI